MWSTPCISNFSPENHKFQVIQNMAFCVPISPEFMINATRVHARFFNTQDLCAGHGQDATRWSLSSLHDDFQKYLVTTLGRNDITTEQRIGITALRHIEIPRWRRNYVTPLRLYRTVPLEKFAGVLEKTNRYINAAPDKPKRRPFIKRRSSLVWEWQFSVERISRMPRAACEWARADPV